MSRDFSSNGDEVDCGSDAQIDDILDGGGTFFCWAYTRSNGGGNNSRVMAKADSGNSEGWFIMNNLDNGSGVNFEMWVGFSTTVGKWNTNSTYPITLNQWNTQIMQYNDDSTANNPTFDLNGSDVSLTEQQTPVGSYVTDAGYNLFIGNRSTSARQFDGLLFYVAMWTSTLTANQKSALSNGVNPFVIDNANLAFFMPLWGNNSTEPDYVGQVSTGAVTGASRGANNAPSELLENYM